MPAAPKEPDAAGKLFRDVALRFGGEDGVTLPPGGGGFGRSALRVEGKIFAMFVRGALVVKLPAERVGALVAEKRGVHFDANKGTPMREWFSLDPNNDDEAFWVALATEALAFARQSTSSSQAR